MSDEMFIRDMFKSYEFFFVTLKESFSFKNIFIIDIKSRVLNAREC